MSNIASGLRWYASKPSNPQLGDTYFDHNTSDTYTYGAGSWHRFNAAYGVANRTFSEFCKEYVLRVKYDE